MRIRRMPPTEKKITNPLAGLLRCSKCGYAMGRRMYKDSGRAYFIHADWSNGTRGGCDCKSVRTDIIMDMLVDSLKATMKDQVVALDSGGAKERIAKLEADIENMRGEIERSRKSLVDAYYRLDRGVIDEVTYKRVSQIENERIERLEDSIEKARREIAATDSDKIEARIVSLREMLAALNDGSLPADKARKLQTSALETCRKFFSTAAGNRTGTSCPSPGALPPHSAESPRKTGGSSLLSR